MEEKNIFHENPVEVRSFDGTVLNWFEWNLPPYATQLLGTCRNGIAAHWSVQNVGS
jgi:hypothetical protein